MLWKSGYDRRFWLMPEHDRSAPENRPQIGNVCFFGLEIRSTSNSRR